MPSFLWSVVEFDGDVDVGSAPDLPARAGLDSIEVKSRFVFGSRWVSFRCLLVQLAAVASAFRGAIRFGKK